MNLFFIHYLSFNVARPIIAKIIDMIQNLTTTVDSGQPFFSKWWCIGAILNILFPVSLNDITCAITETASNTNNPPVIARTISCFVIIPTAPKDPPKANEPVSPMNILAGGALNHKKPKQDPIIAPQKIDASPTPSMYVICKYPENTIFPVT